MNKNPSSLLKTPSAGLKDCCHHTSPDNLTRLIHEEEPCLGTEERYACSEINCQWRTECHEATPIWLEAGSIQ